MPTRRPITIDDLLATARASSPVFSPDGRYAVTAVTRPDAESDSNHTHLYRVEVGGGAPRRLTADGTSNTHPAFSPDGAWLAFTSNRRGTPQIWVLPAAGGEARRITDWPLGARGPVWFPGSGRLLVAAAVYRDAPDREAVEKREAERKEAGTSPRVIDELMFRHWDSWTEGRIDHLFSVDVESGRMTDLTPGPYPAPPRSLSGAPEYAVSPDGDEVCFVSLRDLDQALSTNLNLWRIPAGGGEPRRISPGEGANTFPAYSPDGRFIAYCAMERAGYEADRRELRIFDRASGEVRAPAPGFDRSPGAPVWSPDGTHLYFAAQDRGATRVFRLAASGGEPVPVTGGATDSRPAVHPESGYLLGARESFVSPPELHRIPAAGGVPEPVTAFNASLLEELDLDEGEDFWFEGARGARVHGFLIRPPGFSEGERYPVVFLIHGGPQSMFGPDFHERWNPQVFASRGFVVVMINPRGSTGYGQAFTDAIRGEWGGACYEDLIRGFDHVLETYPFCDPGRTGAAGASFGGFMVNWMAGRTDRFRCLVSHDGIFNTEMMHWLTDELWFTEWEFEGPPWESPEAYRRYSPHLHVQNMSTPMLVIQGEQDFRCVTAEGLGLFTALKRRGVPARLLYLPDEGHWVLKPRNRRVWYETVLDWLERYLKPGEGRPAGGAA